MSYNAMQMSAMRDDENRERRKQALQRIEGGQKRGLDFVLKAIDDIQHAQTNLRFVLKATDEAARTELRYVKFLYWNDMDRHVDSLRKNTDKVETLLGYIAEALRNIYDDINANADIDTEKMVAQLRSGVNSITPECDMFDPESDIMF